MARPSKDVAALAHLAAEQDARLKVAVAELPRLRVALGAEEAK